MLEWDLSVLFKDENDLLDYTQDTISKSLAFKENEGKLKNLSNDEFLNVLLEFEKLNLALNKIMTYAYLVFAKDTSKGVFLAKFEEESKKIEENLLFFELEFCALSDKKSKEIISFINDYSHCETNYGYYLETLIKQKKYMLSKKEERIMLHLSNSGANAFSRLFDESMARLRINFNGKKLSEEEILSKLYSAKRSDRKKAAKAFSKVLRKNAHLLSFILNTIKTELRTKCHLRGYESAETPRHLSNQISQKSVDSLINIVEKNFDIVDTFYKRKKQILGLAKLKDYDRYAPIGKESKFDFKKSKDIVLKAFDAFSPKFKEIAKSAFDEGWIDVYPALNKQGGAFSHSSVPDTHPFILLNYTNTRRDLFTLAHELGHSIHQKLSYKVSFLNQNTPLTTAETASVFAEMLVFDYVKTRLKKNELIALYAAKLEDIFATLYRQINFTTFERRIHASENNLSIEELSKIWMEESQKMFKESVHLSDDYALWFAYIPHFIHSPFYCYAYAYAQLLVLALYGLYKSGKCDNFSNLYINLLESGGSKSPKELISSFGFDIDDDEFWQIGIEEVKKILNEFLVLKQG
ncbi:M3 family oligoendopeptidase [Campylobacter sp. LR264d]|uniref:M3 family oligoendopeptidase n=1 Tax=Campylobacter sp. LR264d TaxID=2593544 RepID=UPI00123ABF5C|nr:M3 family oligoendopeptidase [Campylobacter sp. LR264d]KAA6229460.1 M3 family oligoendopeptidase [Campylobacter sp. LR264d]